MSTTTVTPVEEKPFDSKAFIDARNKGVAPPVRGEAPKADPKPPVEAKPPAPPPPAPVASDDEEETGGRPSRSFRRMERNLGAAEARAELLAQENERLRKLVEGKPAGAEPAVSVDDDAQPQRAKFASDGEYDKALRQWEAREEARKILAKRDEDTFAEETQRALAERVRESTTKMQEDVKLFPDWDAVQKASAENEDHPKIKPQEHPGLMTLLATSDVQAGVLYHMAKFPEVMQRLIDLKDKPADQVQYFRRLEGKVETLYNSERKPAQGSGTDSNGTGKTASTPQKEQPLPGGTDAAELDARKPRPSSEVKAEGGSAPPAKPPIGSAAWIDERNRMQFAKV